MSRSIRAVESPQLPSSPPPVAVPETDADVTVPEVVNVTMLPPLPPLPPEPPFPPVGVAVGVGVVEVTGGAGSSVVEQSSLGSGAGSWVFDGSGVGS